MSNVAIIGSGPTGIYTLKYLIVSKTPLSITVFEAEADAGKGTPYHPRANDRAMLANIASIEFPPICESLVAWLRGKTPSQLELLGVSPTRISEREFFPRVVIGDYLQEQFQGLVALGVARGHIVDVKTLHRVKDIEPKRDNILLTIDTPDRRLEQVFDAVVMATGHDWPERTETKPGYFISPWPASNLDTIGDVSVGVLGTSLSAIDAVASVATSHGSFMFDLDGDLQYRTTATDGFHITMMSRKGLLPEADFFCPIPYEPLSIMVPAAIDDLIANSKHGLLDKLFELFRAQLHHSDPEYADRIGLGALTVETVAEAYFADRERFDPFTWAALNLGEAKANKQSGTTIAWRYAILRMHEEVLRVVPHFNDVDLVRFHKHVKTMFVDDYATVPHQSIERLLALHRAGRLSVMRLGSEYDLDTDALTCGATIRMTDESHEFGAFIDATGQHAVSACDVPFPNLIRQGVVHKALTEKASTPFAMGDDTAVVATGGIDLDDKFRPKFDRPLSHELYCVSIPFLLHKLPFVQGITSAEQLGRTVADAILRKAEKGGEEAFKAA